MGEGKAALIGSLLFGLFLGYFSVGALEILILDFNRLHLVEVA